ncbi:MAG: thiamine-phosphate kinase [Deltaproteobacteria bacterium]|nr:thiamine-phosphate kinase [Deltaproteobacteria bacterium]
MQIKELGELALIKRLAEQFAASHPRVIKGIGDDASVTIQDESTYLLCTTDTLVEDIHFSLKYTPSYNLGRKAVSISLSDIAAMGGTPTFLLASIILPVSTTTDFVNLLYKGIKERAEEFDVKLIGGNTSSSPDKIIISTTMLGEVSKDRVVLREGASVGDNIYVTGRLGDSALGMKILNKIQESEVRPRMHLSGVGSQKPEKKKGNEIITAPFLKDAVTAHIDPCPRVREGRKIAEKKLATAMIDVSDGLISDLRHIAEQSAVGAKVWVEKIPISTGLKRWILDHPQDIMLALNGGEDYELLFTASNKDVPKLETVSRELDIAITHIGEIVPKRNGINVLNKKGEVLNLTIEGFEHFKERQE